MHHVLLSCLALRLHLNSSNIVVFQMQRLWDPRVLQDLMVGLSVSRSQFQRMVLKKIDVSHLLSSPVIISLKRALDTIQDMCGKINRTSAMSTLPWDTPLESAITNGCRDSDDGRVPRV